MKNSLIKIVTSFSVIVLLISLAGCGNKKTQESTTENKKKEPKQEKVIKKKSNSVKVKVKK